MSSQEKAPGEVVEGAGVENAEAKEPSAQEAKAESNEEDAADVLAEIMQGDEIGPISDMETDLGSGEPIRISDMETDL
jgi:hypothetical protein